MMVLSKSFSVLLQCGDATSDADHRPSASQPAIDHVRPDRRDDGAKLSPPRSSTSSRLFALPRRLVRRGVRDVGRRLADDADPTVGPKSPGRGSGHPDLPTAAGGGLGSTRNPPPPSPPACSDNRWACNTITALWGSCTIKAMVGFLFLYPAFVMGPMTPAAGAIGHPRHESVGRRPRELLAGNFTAARLRLGRPACWWSGRPSRSA